MRRFAITLLAILTISPLAGHSARANPLTTGDFTGWAPSGNPADLDVTGSNGTFMSIGRDIQAVPAAIAAIDTWGIALTHGGLPPINGFSVNWSSGLEPGVDFSPSSTYIRYNFMITNADRDARIFAFQNPGSDDAPPPAWSSGDAQMHPAGIPKLTTLTLLGVGLVGFSLLHSGARRTHGTSARSASHPGGGRGGWQS